MRWPDTARLVDSIREERPELIVDSHGGLNEHYHLRVYAILREGRRLIRESLDTIYGKAGWERYKQEHPAPWCAPQDSYHTDALGREVDHRGLPVTVEPPPAGPVTAEAMLGRIIALNRADPDWWKRPEQLAEVAAIWGVRVGANGVMPEYESEEVARLSGDCHASVLVARTGSGLVASGYAARWGDGGCLMEPSVLSVPFDTEPEARRAALRELISSLEAGRRSGQREGLLEAVRERQRRAGLFG